MTTPLLSKTIPYRHLYSGKVRDTYEVAANLLLMVASDRISAFDVVLPSTVPDKGSVLTQLSRFWFDHLSNVIPNHLADAELHGDFSADLRQRAMLVHKADRIPVECVVRGYISGSGWVEYQGSGSIAGHSLSSGLRHGDQISQAIFTPARKNDTGHDENISVDQLRAEIGPDLAKRLEQASLDLYHKAHSHALSCGLIIADTKFEFGWIDGQLALIDELLTPDSSRFWDAAHWKPGGDQPSFDKQFVRDWLLERSWDREPPGPELPEEVIAGTRERYLEAFRRLTGEPLALWLARRQAEVTA